MEWGSKCSDLETQLELAAVQKEEVGHIFFLNCELKTNNQLGCTG